MSVWRWDTYWSATSLHGVPLREHEWTVLFQPHPELRELLLRQISSDRPTIRDGNHNRVATVVRVNVRRVSFFSRCVHVDRYSAEGREARHVAIVLATLASHVHGAVVAASRLRARVVRPRGCVSRRDVWRSQRDARWRQGRGTSARVGACVSRLRRSDVVDVRHRAIRQRIRLALVHVRAGATIES